MALEKPSRGMFFTVAAFAAIAPVISGAAAGSRLIINPQTAFAMRAVASHNLLRAAVGVQPSYGMPNWRRRPMHMQLR